MGFSPAARFAQMIIFLMDMSLFIFVICAGTKMEKIFKTGNRASTIVVHILILIIRNLFVYLCYNPVNVN